jgi:hypothetical protein
MPAGSAPDDDPTPTTSDGGRSMTRPTAWLRSVTTMSLPAGSDRRSSGRGQSRRVDFSTLGGLPSSQARATPAMSPLARKPGRASSAGRPAASLAVVTTASASSRAATSVARSLAPWWPPVSATAQHPPSSRQTTAGSVCLSPSSGAIKRTAMPVAQTSTRPSTSDHSERTLVPSSPARCSYGRRPASAAPASVAVSVTTLTKAPSRRRPGSRRRDAAGRQGRSARPG